MASKDRVALIIAKMKGKGKTPSSQDEYSEGNVDASKRGSGSASAAPADDGQLAAAEDMISAFKEEDARGLVSALVDFLHVHSSECADCGGEEEADTNDDAELEDE